jgi:hypothetical protein
MLIQHLLRHALELVALSVNSARVPERCLDAFEGSLTPSIANISRPIKPSLSNTTSTCANTDAIASREREIKSAMAVQVRLGVTGDGDKYLTASFAKANKSHIIATRALDAA